MSHPPPHRPALAAFCLIAGMTVSAAGAAAVFWIGPDDWVRGPSVVANPNGERVVPTAYGALHLGLPSRVSVTAEAGEAFLGVGHIVDTDDYLAGVRVSEISAVGPLQTTIVPLAGSRDDPPADPRGLDFWSARSHGTGTQSVSGDFTGAPTQVVAIALAEQPGTITLTVAAQLPGSHVAAWTLAAVGLALAVASLWWLRPRTRGASASVPAEAADQPANGSAARTLAIDSLACVLAATGCTPAHDTRPALPDRGDVTRPAPTLEEASAAVAALNPRISAARESQGWPTNSLSKQAAAFAEPVLGVVRSNVEWNRVTKQEWHPEALTDVVHGVLAAPSTAYPLTMAAAVELRSKTTPRPKERYLHLYVREHSYAPWKLAGELPSTQDQMPLPGDTLPTSTQQEDGERLARLLVNTVVDGDRTGSISLPKAFWTYRQEVLKAESYETVRWTKPTADPAVVYTMSTTEGPLVYVAFVVRTVFRGKSGPLRWVPPDDSYHHCYGDHDTLTDDTLLEFAIRARGDRADVELWDASDYLSEHPTC